MKKNVVESIDDNIINLLKNSKISASKIANKLGISSRTVQRHLRELQEKGVIKHVGPDKGGYWEVKE